MNGYFRENMERLILCKTSNLDFPPHIHEEFELVYMVDGSCTACCADRQYDLHAGDFFLAFPEQVHHYRHSHECLAYLIIVHPKRLGLTHGTAAQAVYSCQDEELQTLLELTMREHLTQNDPAVTLPMLQAVLGKLLRHYTIQDDPGRDSVAVQLVRYCSSHYKEPLRVSSVAKAMYLSQSHISHIFNEKLKISFSDYVNSLRLDEAIRLLKHTHLSMEQIAETSGFPTVRTFNRVFRAKYGVSPSQYRKSSL